MATDRERAWAGLEVLVLTPVPTHPATLGNRVRILEVCRLLKAQGARITLLHYPTDEDWRTRMPVADHAAMATFFDEVHLVAPTRPPHTAPWPGPDHAIDAWWDPAIGAMLDWLCGVRRFDAVLVNYTWLSKALDHVPRGVLRILDTHDRFAGRRQLLAAHGIAPEYFHTTDEEEAKAIARADLVWAIKGEEAAHFRALGAREVVTVPHGEKLSRRPMAVSGWRSGAPVLRLGIAGGRNRINAENLRAFLAAAEPMLRRTLLPVEVVVAGSVCDLVPDLARSWVHLKGTVESMDALYDHVDVVLAPLAFSTGLKIRVGEALARGKALIAHAHAFEGFPAAHPFHVCADFPAMLRAIRAVAREPALIGVLEEASAEAALRTRARMERAVAHAGRRAREARRSTLIVVEAARLRPDSLVFDHVRDAATMLGQRGALGIHLLGDPGAAEPDCLRLLRRYGALTVEPGTAASHRASFTVATLAEAMAGRHAALFAALPRDAPAGVPLGLAHLDVLALTMPADALDARLPALARGCGTFRLLQGGRGALGAALLAPSGPGAAGLACPMLARGHDSALVRALLSAPAGGVAVLAARGAAPALLPVFAFLTRVLGLRPTLYAADGAVPRVPEEGPLSLPAGALLTLPAEAFYRPETHRRTRPRFAVEIGASPGFAAAREILSHARIPMARIFEPGASRSASFRSEAFTRCDGLMPALLALDHLARADQQFVAALETEAGLDAAGQAGWAAVLDALAAVAESPSA